MVEKIAGKQWNNLQKTIKAEVFMLATTFWFLKAYLEEIEQDWRSTWKILQHLYFSNV